jgi:hypothetical protein
MLKIKCIVILVLIVQHLSCQEKYELPGNSSLEKDYKRINPELKYSYNELSQTHDYSGNWDLDGDKKKDSVLFIGNGGAHLYFHLKVVLTSDKKGRDFLFLLTDMPLLHAVDSLQRKLTENLPFPKFVVADFNNDGRNDIYLNVGPMDSKIPTKWKNKGVTSRHLVVTYESKDLTIKNYSQVLAGKK